jgi:hypothetical protein
MWCSLEEYMFIRKVALMAVVSAIGALGASVSSASAATWITDELGNNPSTITSNASDPATLSLASGFGDITCNRTTFNMSVGAGGGASVSGTLNSLVFENCTDSIPVITISQCSLSGGTPTATITASAGGGTVALSTTTVFCAVAGSSNGCYYQAPSASGSANNAANSITFTNVTTNHVSGTGDLGALCGSGGAFGVTLTQVVNAANNSPVTLLTAP